MSFRYHLATLAVLLTLALGALAPRLRADPITYDYVGHPFTNFSNGFTCSLPFCGITGSMTLDNALGRNIAYTGVSPVSYSFTNGQETFDNTNSSIETGQFFVSTDSSGNIWGWLVSIQHNSGDYTQVGSLGGFFSPKGDSSQEGTLHGNVAASTAGATGSWTIASPVPEPPTWLLLSTGVLVFGLGLVVERRRHAPHACRRPAA